MINLKNFSKPINWTILTSLILCIYFFTAFLPLPKPISIGLDPSWSYTLSEAARNHLIFGQDIIFTYGPLGYLVGGAALDHNFLQLTFFRWFIYLLLFIVTAWRIVIIKTYYQRIFLCLTIIFALLTTISTDYQILFIFLITLSFDNFVKKNPRLIFLLLGVFSGFCALTKFTLGVYTFGAITLLLLCNIFQSIQQKSKLNILNSSFGIINFCLGFISTSLILLEPSLSLVYLKKISINLFVSGVIGGALFLFQKRSNKYFYDRFKILAKFLYILKNYHLLPWLLFYGIYFLLLIHIVFSSQSPSLIDYIKNSLEISSGYSSAMSLISINRNILAFAISDLFIIICVIFLISKQGYLHLCLPLFFVLLLSFKHGFVRQDIYHIESFAIIAPLIISLLILKNSKLRYKKVLYCIYIYIFLVSLNTLWVEASAQFQRLEPHRVINNLAFLSDIGKLQSKIKKETKEHLANNQLPSNIKKLVNGKPIDIIPWEVSLVPANQLNWKPRPIFQSYSSYTTALDNINSSSLSKGDRDYLFYQFLAIDERHPFFDEPKTFFYVFCNYEPSAEISGFVNTPTISNIIVLGKRKVSRCSPNYLSKILSINWNTPHSIEPTSSDIIRAKFKFQYSLLGKIYKVLFRAPPVMMNINYIDGSKKAYRIIPENSENGVIVSHLPKDDNEALSFLRGQLPSQAQVKSFSFQTSNSLLYVPRIEMSFSSDLLRP